jgi:AcrR family transcriptional regulator
MADEKRSYRKQRRALQEEETRRRITESAVELHGTLGPARTSIVAIAEHAGVRRSTVYRHFPDEEALFTACSSHWAAENPPPDLERWKAIEEPGERLKTALEELYAHYRQTERMMDKVLRDEPRMPVLTQMLGPYRAYLVEARDTLMEGREVPGDDRERVLAAISHALAFSTWRSLTRDEGLADLDAVGLMRALVEVACVASEQRVRCGLDMRAEPGTGQLRRA